MGLIRLRTGETFPGIHPPLIPKSLFDRVQRILTGRTQTCSGTHDFLFRRLLTCKLCGYLLSGELQKGHVYYRCHTKKCPMKCIREETVEEAIPEQLFPLQFDEEEKAYVQEKVGHLREHWGVEREQQITTLKLQLSQLNDRFNRLTDAYIDRLIEKGIFENRKAALLLEIKDLEEKRAELESQSVSVPNRLAEFLELAGSVYVQYEMALPEEKRDLLKIVTSNRFVGNCTEGVHEIVASAV